MLRRLGFRRFAYDWRAEHLPTFERELAALKDKDVELTAVWFPGALNADARSIVRRMRPMLSSGSSSGGSDSTRERGCAPSIVASAGYAPRRRGRAPGRASRPPSRSPGSGGT